MRKFSPTLQKALVAILFSALLSGVAGVQAASDPARVGANVSVPAAPAVFGYGVNFGNPSGWYNPALATVSARAGLNSARLKLPEYFFDRWGYGIEFSNGDMAAYQSNGLTNLTVNLIGPTSAHSTSSTGGDLDRHSPKNLYQPIWSSPGVVNPNNYWANYVYKVVSNYKGQVKFWEVWNEPDATGNWSATQGAWWTSPPNPRDLPNWNDSVFAYIRTLRITYEVVKALDPNAFVAIGGIGYESFLDALLRYTDNPADGSVTSAYPARGGAWFDAVNFHHYPQYATYDQANNTWLRGTDSDAMATSFAAHLNTLRMQTDRWSFDGATHPRKVWMATETGVSSKAVGGPGGSDLQRNYLLKMPILARASGASQVDWFQLSDTEADSSSSSLYAHMGLYYNLSGKNTSTAQLKPSANALKTYGAFLRNQSFDAATTSALSLPAGVRGYVFRLPDGRKTYAVWAMTSGNSENASASLQLPTRVALEQRLWDFGATQAVRTLTPSNGSVSLSLSSAPVFLTETVAGGSDPGTNPTATATPTPPPSATSVPTATPTPAPQATATPAPAGSGSLTNTGFETDANRDNKPDGWLISSPGEALVSRSSSQHVEGSYSLLASSRGGETFTVFQDLAVTPGESYSFTGQMNVPANSGWFRASFQLLTQTPDGRVLTSATSRIQQSNTSGWTAFPTSITIPANATTLRVQLKVEYLRADVYIDQISLTRSGISSGGPNPVSPPPTATPPTAIAPTATPTPVPQATATPAPAGSGSLTNTGFETDANRDNKPDGWLISSPGEALVSRSSSQHVEGSYSLLASSRGGETFTVFQDLAVTPGESYSFTGQMNVPANSGWFRASFQLLTQTPDGRVLTSATSRIQQSNTSGWTAFPTSITIPTNATTLRVQLKVEYLRADVYIDQISLTRTN